MKWVLYLILKSCKLRNDFFWLVFGQILKTLILLVGTKNICKPYTRKIFFKRKLTKSNLIKNKIRK